MYPQQIIDALQHVRYPGTGKNLIESGMLEDDIRISGLEVSFSLIFEKDNDPFRKSVVKAAETAIHTYVDENAAVHIHTKFVKQNMAPKSDSVENLRAGQVIAIHSGKGGVGKSTVTSMLAVAASRMGYKTGILDADVLGPSIPKMFGLEPGVQGTDSAIFPKITHNDIQVMSVNLLLDNPADPVVWRGSMVSGVIKQSKWSNKEITVSYFGGIFHAGEFVLRPLEFELSKYNCKLVPPKKTATEGALLLAINTFNK
jgi:ATP-binding protein involved in chromosome partitioning